jgi:hypothetical protein
VVPTPIGMTARIAACSDVVGPLHTRLMTSDEDAVRACFSAFEAAWDSGDLPSVLALCAPNFEFIGSGEGEDARGGTTVS